MRYGLLFLLGGGVYVALEHFWRGFSHVSMFFAGGVSLMLLAGVYGRYQTLPYALLCLIGAVLFTAVEFITGAVVNGLLGLGVWDYSGRRGNVYGQICPLYSLLWLALSAFALMVIQVVNAL